MAIILNRIGQIAFGVSDIDAAERFYRDAIGLRHLFRFGDLTFFDCAGTRLLLEKSAHPSPGATLYFACPDIALTVAALQARGITFTGKPHLIAPMEDHDLWMAFFRDPDGNSLAVMQEAPKGYAPA